MNGVVILVLGLVAMAIIKLIIDKNWVGLALCIIALFFVLGVGHSSK